MTVIIAHVMFTLGYVVVTIRARLEGMDLHIEEAAMDLGASQLTTIRKITLPLIMPGVVAAGLLAFAISIDDFVVTNFTAGPYQTFPLFVYGAAKQGVPPQVNVLATALLIVALLGMFANLWYQRRAARRDARAMPEGAATQAGLTRGSRVARCAPSSFPAPVVPRSCEVQERPDPGRRPGPGAHRRSRAAGVNFADTLARIGLYEDAPPLPAVVGYEVAGTVADGRGGRRRRRGRRPGDGGHAVRRLRRAGRRRRRPTRSRCPTR